MPAPARLLFVARKFDWVRVLGAMALPFLGVRSGTGQTLQFVPSDSHREGVISVAYAPNGRIIASTSWDRTIRLWDARTGRQLRVIDGLDLDPRVVAFSPDGRELAAGSDYPNCVTVWDVRSGQLLFRLRGTASAIAFSSDGRALAAGGTNNFVKGGDNTIRVWDLRHRRIRFALRGHTNGIEALAFSPGSLILASASWDGTVRLWNARTGRALRTLAKYASPVMGLAFSPDGKRLAVGGYQAEVDIFDLGTRRLLQKLSGSRDVAWKVAFSPDGALVAAGCGNGDQTIRLWNWRSGRLLHTLRRRAEFGVGYYSAHDINAVAFSPDRRTLASGCTDHSLRLWDVATGTEREAIGPETTPVAALAFSPDGRTLATGNKGELSVRLWSLKSGAGMRKLTNVYTGTVRALAYAPDGVRLASAGWGAVSFWTTGPGLQFKGIWNATWRGTVDAIAYSPDGRSLITGSDDMAVRIWNSVNGHALPILQGHTGGIRSVAWSPDGRRIASGSYDRTVRLWDVTTGECERTFICPTGAVRAVAFASSGEALAAGSERGDIRVWNPRTGALGRVMSGPRMEVLSVAFTPDGRRIVAGYGDTARVWSLETGQLEHVLLGNCGPIRCVSVSPDGRTIAGAGDAGTVKLWDLETGQELCRLVAFNDTSWLVLAPDGRYDSSGGRSPSFGYFDLQMPRRLPEAVGFEQLSSARYYVPGLLRRLVSRDLPPNPCPLAAQRPYPRVDFRVVGRRVRFRATPRFGGGVGAVEVFVGGRCAVTFEAGTLRASRWHVWQSPGPIWAPVDVVAENRARTLRSR